MPSNALDKAIARAHELPDADQERIGRELNSYIDQLEALRADLGEGVRSLDAGKGRSHDIEDVISRAHALHARA